MRTVRPGPSRPPRSGQRRHLPPSSVKNGLQSEAGGGGERDDGPHAARVTKRVPSWHPGAKLTARRQSDFSSSARTFAFLLLVNDLYFVWVFRGGGG